MLGLLVDEKYTIADAQTQREIAQYFWAIMRQATSCDIVNIAN